MSRRPPPPDRVRLAFLGCGFITSVHSRQLSSLRGQFVCSYASRDLRRAQEYQRRYGGEFAFASYEAALSSPDIDAVVIAVPPRFHFDLTVMALQAGKHVLVEKPAFLSTADYRAVIRERDAAGSVVCVGENDHYKPLAVTLRTLLASGVIGDLVLAQFTTVAWLPKPAGDWRNDENMAGGDAFFEEGIHWLHLAGSLGPKISQINGYRPAPPKADLRGDVRGKSILVAFEYDTGAVGALFYSREVPSLLRGLRLSKLFGREGAITFESNGALVLVHGRSFPKIIMPGIFDLRGYRAMFLDFAGSIRSGGSPEMNLERALVDHLLMENLNRA